MAASILKGLHLPPLVSSTEIDAGNKTVTATENCKVADVVEKEGGIAFQRHDQALPFFPPDAMSILKWAPILEELNVYTLKVTGLKDGSYKVRLGGQKIAVHTAGELAKGVNLATAALASGPIKKQVLALKAAVERKNAFHHDRIFRGLVLSTPAEWKNVPRAEIEKKRQAAVAEKMAMLADYDAQVRQALEMKPYTVEVIPVTN